MIKSLKPERRIRRDSAVEICSTIGNWNLDPTGIPRLSPYSPFDPFLIASKSSNTARILPRFLAQWLLDPSRKFTESTEKYLWRASWGYWLSSNCCCKCTLNSSKQTIAQAASIVFDDNDLIFSTNLGGSAPAKESILGHTPRIYSRTVGQIIPITPVFFKIF